MTDKERFEWARDKIVGTEREKQGIGTLSEKTVHAVLKNFYAPDEDMHEIPIEGWRIFIPERKLRRYRRGILTG